MKVAISDTGTVTAGTIIARTLPRNSQITAITIATAIARVFQTSAMEASMKTLES